MSWTWIQNFQLMNQNYRMPSVRELGAPEHVLLILIHEKSQGQRDYPKTDNLASIVEETIVLI
jgi:hypothetical protein